MITINGQVIMDGGDSKIAAAVLTCDDEGKMFFAEESELKGYQDIKDAIDAGKQVLITSLEFGSYWVAPQIGEDFFQINLIDARPTTGGNGHLITNFIEIKADGTIERDQYVFALTDAI